MCMMKEWDERGDSSNCLRLSSLSPPSQKQCPHAYSWQFDDLFSTYQCRDADYTITFCEHGPYDRLKPPSPHRPEAGSTQCLLTKHDSVVVINVQDTHGPVRCINGGPEARVERAVFSEPLSYLASCSSSSSSRFFFSFSDFARRSSHSLIMLSFLCVSTPP